MKPIVTLTLNPSIDGSSEAEAVRPIHKVRTSNERFEPGGGGSNVTRVIHELGGSSLAVYLAGGVTGSVLEDLLTRNGIGGRRIPIRDHTRVSHTVFERTTGLEYRFVPEGPEVAPSEWQDSRGARGAAPGEAFRWGVAAGAAAVLTPGTGLCRREDVERLFGALSQEQGALAP
ncbi:PfkB family carbohydrate kinase [Microvirga sp. BSC39]|uniref:PfkB family carbohydrate kinase n=1 Tax=Microvirga sp. BSC39 TaxID=1549810 RepID=UPI0006908E41|nr:PfkB family carbohydrate kinase [Microvirga sp. BSC39]